MAKLDELFEDPVIVSKIKAKLPYLFQLAELESSRAGKIGMQVGSVRENIIGGLLIHKFGEENVRTDIPITEAETDLMLYGKPISVKTITGRGLGGVKLIWTVDPQKCQEFLEHYYPTCDILLVQIIWGDTGGLYLISLSTQKKVFGLLGRNRYITLPTAGTNPRGATFSRQALETLVSHSESKSIPVRWIKQDLEFNPYKKWVELWQE